MKQKILSNVLISGIIFFIILGVIGCKQANEIKDEVDTIKWKTYSSENHGFEFKYPENFVVGKYKDEPLPDSEAIRKIYKSAGFSEQEIEEKFHPFKNNIVLVENYTSKLVDMQAIPIGQIPDIAIRMHTGKNGKFYVDSLIKNKALNSSEIKINNFTVSKFPGAPGPYGDAGFYYLLPVSDNLVIEITAPKKYPGGKEFANAEANTNYDQVIEKIISTFKIEELK